MIEVKPIDPEDLPLYAMQLLPPEAMEELRLQLQHSLEGRSVLADIYGELAAYAHTAEMHAPASTARQRFMKQVAKAKKTMPAGPLDRYMQQPAEGSGAVVELAPQEPATRKSFMRPVAWGGWLLAAALALFAVMVVKQNDELKTTVAGVRTQNEKTLSDAQVAIAVADTLKDPTAMHATLVSAEVKPQPSGRVTYVAGKGALLFVASNLAPLKPEKTYELWVIPADGRPAMAAGTFKPDEHGNASVVLPELAQGVPAKAFGVTIENAEGSTVPTAPIILSGSAG